MLKLRKILLYDFLYYLIFILVLILVFIRINSPVKNINDNHIKGTVIDIYKDNDRVDLIIKSDNYKIKGTYYKNIDIFLGDVVEVSGSIEKISNTSVFNSFDYVNYMKSKGIKYKIKIDKIEKKKDNRNPFYNIKNKLYKHLDNYKSKSYLYTFILGDNRFLKNKNIFQELGISHLFAVSGMHISIISSIIIKILERLKIKELSKYLISSLFIIFYLFLVSFCPSSLRSGLLFILLLINKYYYFNIKISNILVLTISILLFINPFLVFNTGFLYSATITYFLIVFSNLINKRKYYISKLLMTSVISFLCSFPISINTYYSINISSIIFNLIFVPLISLLVFPLSLISVFIPILDSLLYLLIFILEKLSYICTNLNIILVFGKTNIIYIVIYYLVLFLLLKLRKKLLLVFLLILFIYQYNINIFLKDNYIIFIDVDQGDSTLLHINNKNILIDTGGIKSYYSSNNLAINRTIPMLKSYGIRKIDYLIITHGDFDHMGEAINLVNNFKVEKVIFDCGTYNYLEKELIKVLDKKKIKHYSCIKELNIDKNKLYFLQTKEYDNENDNSNVIYTELDVYKFLFMGDASIIAEKEILDKYNISNIDVLKVGHHGSNTSSSKEFIEEINPKYSIISVGKNNRYGHPNKEVLDNLNDSKIYRTDLDGSIMFKIKNNKLKIETCSP